VVKKQAHYRQPYGEFRVRPVHAAEMCTMVELWELCTMKPINNLKPVRYRGERCEKIQNRRSPHRWRTAKRSRCLSTHLSVLWRAFLSHRAKGCLSICFFSNTPASALHTALNPLPC
jgi:hypothetical protein